MLKITFKLSHTSHNMATSILIDGRRDAFLIFQAINERTIGNRYCLGKTLPVGKEPKMQISVFNDRDEFGGKIEAHDYGFPVSFAEATQAPVSTFLTTYNVKYGKLPLPVSYKVHLSINRMRPERDHISIDMIIHVPKAGIPTASGDIHYGDIFLKFHYFADGLPHLSRKDECFGDIRFKLPPELQPILQHILRASQTSGVLRNFGDDYHFGNSTESDVLGVLVRLTKS